MQFQIIIQKSRIFHIREAESCFGAHETTKR